MIRNAEVLERLRTLQGRELTSENLHNAIFCEDKHKKILRRFNVGTHTYIQYKVKTQEIPEPKTFVDISIPGNPKLFRVEIEEKNGQVIFISEPRMMSFGYSI